MKPTFNLLDEPWIPCVPMGGGVTTEVGIREVLLNAHKYAEVYCDSPLITVSLHRLLLAVLYRACRPSDSSDWQRLWQGGIPRETVNDYLERWRERFDLFDDKHPFYQVARLRTGSGTLENWVDKPFAVIRLANEAPDQNQPTLFDHRTYDDMSPYPSAVVARWLVASQSFGICSSNSSNVRLGDEIITTPGCKDGLGVAGMLVWLSGQTLQQTLLLNLVPYGSPSCADDDSAAWERDDWVSLCKSSWTNARKLAGPAERYTWQGRLIRLLPGDEEGRTVKAVYFTQGCSAEEDRAGEPMGAYSRKDENTPWERVKLVRDKAAWRDAHALLGHSESRFKPPEAVGFIASRMDDGDLPEDVEYTVNAAGIAKGSNPAKLMLWRHDRFPAPGGLLRNRDLIESLDSAISESEKIARRLNGATRELCKSFLDRGGRAPDPAEVSKLADSIDPTPVYWSRIEPHFYTFLRDLPVDRDKALNEWLEAIVRMARRAFDESSEQLGQSLWAIRARAMVRASFRVQADNAESGKEVKK